MFGFCFRNILCFFKNLVSIFLGLVFFIFGDKTKKKNGSIFGLGIFLLAILRKHGKACVTNVWLRSVVGNIVYEIDS